MKFVIAIALIATAAGLPEPISLPRAALPTLEAKDALPNAEPVELPKAALPAYEDDAIHTFEAIDISPVMVPEEVMEAVRLAQLAEIAEYVKFVDNAGDVTINALNEPAEALAYDEVPVGAIKVEEGPEVVYAPIDVDNFGVRVVEFAHDADTLADDPFAVRVIDNAEDIPAALDGRFAAGELEALRIAFPIPSADFQGEEIIPDAVRFVDAPFRRPGKIFSDPRMR